MSLSFFESLNTIEDFQYVTDDSYYIELPEDWVIIITDVKGSTKAIEAGLYKEINTLGAATISCIQNELNSLHFPFVFGGDGSSVALSMNDFEKVKVSLSELRNLAKNQFSLDLRVGSIEVKTLKNLGKTIKLAKLAINPHQAICLFSGGGLKLADLLIKKYPEKYELPNVDMPESLNLNSLSCRWNPVPSQHGQIMTILIDSTSEKVYQRVLNKIKEICNGDFSNASPTHKFLRSYKSFFQCLKEEVKLHNKLLSLAFLQRLIEIISSIFLFKWQLGRQLNTIKQYNDNLDFHTDYKKYDDVLRLILDCTNKQVEALNVLLSTEYANNNLLYGVHLSDSALMTCLVQTIGDGDHIHFIDGNHGGYTAAATKLKQQILQNQSTKPSLM